MAEEENIRTYTFPVSGFIPGVPGMFSGGSRVTINDDTKEVLDVWPQPVEAPQQAERADAPVEAAEPEAASSGTEGTADASVAPEQPQQEEQGSALPEQSAVSLEDALKMMGG